MALAAAARMKIAGSFALLGLLAAPAFAASPGTPLKDAHVVSARLQRAMQPVRMWDHRGDALLGQAARLLKSETSSSSPKLAQDAERHLAATTSTRRLFDARSNGRINASRYVGGTIELPVSASVSRSGWMATTAKQAMHDSSNGLTTVASRLQSYMDTKRAAGSLPPVEAQRMTQLRDRLVTHARVGWRLGDAVDAELARTGNAK